MAKYKAWAVKVDPLLSKIVQTLAFSFGYRWYSTKNEKVDHVNRPYLVFNPDDKDITWTSTPKDYEIIVYSSPEAFKLFENPPVEEEEETLKLFGGNVVLNKQGDIEIFAEYIKSEDFEKIIEERNKFLGKTPTSNQKLPKVSFFYPKGLTDKCRHVLVTNFNQEYLEGLDVNDNYQYKKFKRTEMGRIDFQGFEER